MKRRKEQIRTTKDNLKIMFKNGDACILNNNYLKVKFTKYFNQKSYSGYKQINNKSHIFSACKTPTSDLKTHTN